MHHGNNNLRRAHASASNAEDITLASSFSPIDDTSSPTKRKSKIAKSIISLSCQRWKVKFLAMRRTSQVMMTIITISLLMLLPSTIYVMSSLSVAGYNGVVDRTRNRNHRHRGGNDNNRNSMPGKIPAEYDKNNMVFDVYGIYSEESRKKFAHRRTFPALEPRVLRLTDNNHTHRLEFPPGAVSATNSSLSSYFSLPRDGLRELRSKYVEVTLENPKQLSAPDPLGKGDCEAIDASWQKAYHHNCNVIHEASGGWQKLYRMPTAESGSSLFETLLKEASGPDDHHREQTRFVNGGAFRHVWMIRDADGITKRAMKTLRSLRRKEKKFDLRNHDRHRRDAISFQELQSSPLVVDIYASCSNTAIFDYADRGDLLGIFNGEGEETTRSPEENEIFELYIMQIAYNVSLSIHDAHHFDAQGRATMAHTDIKTDQFIYQDGYYKLSDFNRVRFLTWDSKRNQQCGFHVGKNGGEYRSPEEYAYKEETEKVDVYSLGNVLYFLLVRKEVWKEFHHGKVYDLVKAGQRPSFPKEIKESDGIFEKYMIKAIEGAWVHDPKHRPGALEVANIIKEGIELKKKSMMK